MNSISMPCLVVDGQGKVTFANRAMEISSGFQGMSGRNYLEFIKEPGFIRALQDIRRHGKPLDTEISLWRKVFLVSFSIFGDTGNILVSLRDVTAEKEVEKIKKELVTNMSHELKTPLTAIKGYGETLRDEVTGEPRKYLDVILKHADRLISIVNDILSLSGLEETKPELVPVDISDLIRETSSLFSEKMKKRKIELILDLDESNRIVPGDRFKMEELFINLIDNAVRYTDEGNISIRSFLKDDLLNVTIRDTGIGIPERSLPRIFERFYVVDKSRSRETGGTGLGLSIVKHIMMLHKGNIEISSRLGSGTEILLKFPLHS